MVMMMVVMVQWGGGRRGRGQSRSARTGGRATGTSAQSRRCLHRFHLRFHQGGEDGLETRHFHATAAAIVRRHRLVGDVGSRRRHRHRHLFTCPRRLRHITLIGSYRGDRCAVAIGCDAGTIGPLPKRSQTVGLPFLRDGAPVVRWWQFLQEARQHQAGYLSHHRRTGKRERERFPQILSRLLSSRDVANVPLTAPFINLPRDFRATLLTIFFPRNSYKPHKSWTSMFFANTSALAADAFCINGYYGK